MNKNKNEIVQNNVAIDISGILQKFYQHVNPTMMSSIADAAVEMDEMNTISRANQESDVSGNDTSGQNVVDISGNNTSGQNAVVKKREGLYTYKEIDDNFSVTYSTDEFNNSSICDILALYVKGQKILYTEAKTHCEQKLTCLMLPAIFITVVCSVISVVLKDYDYGTTITSGLNGINAFILALINYLKLDTRAEAHRTSAYKYDKLQADLEFSSGKLLFNSDFSKELGKVIDKAEAQVREIKETNQFVLPESIRKAYPLLHGTNLFAQVKFNYVEEMKKMNKLKDMLNKRLLHNQLANRSSPTWAQTQFMYTLELNKLIEDLIEYKREYIRLDTKFTDELERNSGKKCRTVGMCEWFKV